MSETGTKDWKVLDFRVGKTEPNPHGGNFQKLYVDFEGSPDTYWRRREGDVPEKGKSYYGTIIKGDYGPKFKKEKAPDQGSSGGKRDWQPESQRDPERSARILRQHSQEMAIRILALHKTLAAVDLKAEIERWANWFDADVGQAASQAQSAEKSEGAAPPLASPSSESEKQPADDSHQWISKLLEDAGLNPDAASTLADYALKYPKAIKRVENKLQDLETQQAQVDDLRVAFEKETGELLPSPEDADLPF